MAMRTGDSVLLVFDDDGFYGWDIEFLTFTKDHSGELFERVSTATAGIRAAGNENFIPLGFGDVRKRMRFFS